MKAHRKTLWLFLATVAVFWLALGLTSFIPRIARDDWEERQITAQNLAGVTEVEIDTHTAQELPTGEVEIDFSDTADQAVAHVSGQSQAVTAETLFERKGNKLVVHFASRGRMMTRKDGSKWWVQKVVLPRSVTQIYSANLPVKIKTKTPLSTLTINGTGVEVEADRIDALDITSHTRAVCDDPCAKSTVSVSTVEVTGKNIPKVTISIVDGSIRLNGTDTMQQIHLHATPATAIYLDRIDTLKRLDWQVLAPSRAAELAKPLQACPPKAPASTPEAAAQAASEVPVQQAQCAAAAVQQAAQTVIKARPASSRP